MTENLAVRIKQQPFAPSFVIAIGEKEVSARVHKLDDDHVVAHINGRGTYRIDITDVGFFFVEKEAQPCSNSKAFTQLNGTPLARVLRRAAKSVGEHCGDVFTEFESVLTVLSPRGRR